MFCFNLDIVESLFTVKVVLYIFDQYRRTSRCWHVPNFLCVQEVDLLDGSTHSLLALVHVKVGNHSIASL
ncbi:hypothetical protein RJT34_25060 [Clitoria ternatea]|uniref:Uncharacterized protein n=1 Tax=Clitoria ternatea TaxID=43366 RepID=A0AAN9IGI3_CLITE